MPDLLPLSKIEDDAVEKLLDAAFGSDRRNRTAYLLRERSYAIADLSFAIAEEGDLLASIQCWTVRIETTQLVLVGPVAVCPERQGEGFGKMLMHAALDAAAAIGNPAMVMIGDPEYYGRYGFSADVTGGWTLPGPWESHRLLARNVAGHALPLTGILGPNHAL